MNPASVQLYGPSPIKRVRRTSDEIELLDQAIIRAVDEDKPVTMRGAFYRAMSAGAVPKTELGYKTVGRRLVQRLTLRMLAVRPVSRLGDARQAGQSHVRTPRDGPATEAEHQI